MNNQQHHIEQEKLRKLLREKADQIRKSFLAGTPVDKDQTDELERIKQLIDTRERMIPPKRNIQWSFILIFLFSLTIITVLLFARVKKTDIELRVLVSETSFRLPQKQYLTNLMQLTSLGVSGIKEIDLPRSENQESRQLFASGGSSLSIKLSSDDSSQSRGTVTIGALALSAKSLIWLVARNNPEQFRMTVRDSTLVIDADVNGRIKIGTSTAVPVKLNFISPRAIVLKSGSSLVDMDLEMVNGTENSFSQQLMIDSLSFKSVEQHNDDEHLMVRNLSTIVSGSMFMESLDGQEYRFRPAETIWLYGLTGEIRTIGLQEKNIALVFEGSVSEMTTGADNNQKSLMPTYLEWLKSRHSVSLLWGTTLYSVGLIFTLFKWWKNPL